MRARRREGSLTDPLGAVEKRMKSRAGIGIVLAVVAALVVAGAFFLPKILGPQTPADVAPGTTVVKGLIGSEKSVFFQDQRVRDVFAKHGYSVQFNTAGSRQIGTADLSGYDFASPSSQPAAEKVIASLKAKNAPTFTVQYPFHSPMAIATFKPIVEILKTNGVVAEKNGFNYFNVEKYLELVAKDTRWTDLKKAPNAEYNNRRAMLISTTDIRTSNSAMMYMSLTSYVANGNNVVVNAEQRQKVEPVLEKLFLDQGYSATSSESPFEDYLSQGIGSKPMVMVYEAQFLGRQMQENSPITDQMTLMYPEPTVLSKHAFIPTTDNGNKVAELLATDPELQKLIAEHGFRPNNQGVFNDVLKSHKIDTQPDLTNIIEPPSYDVIESMITSLAKR